MDGGHITDLIIQYRYLILLPLSFIEGPIVAFFSGTLAAAGYFNVWILAVFFLVRDVLVDSLCYALGYWGGQKPWVQRMVRRMGVTDEHLNEVRSLWQRRPGSTMFLSKLSYGVAAGFIVVAGLVQSSFKKFLLYGFLTAILHYGVLLMLGYFFGATFGGTITSILEKIPYVVGAIGILAVLYYFFKRYIKRKLVEAEAKAGQEE